MRSEFLTKPLKNACAIFTASVLGDKSVMVLLNLWGRNNQHVVAPVIQTLSLKLGTDLFNAPQEYRVEILFTLNTILIANASHPKYKR